MKYTILTHSLRYASVLTLVIALLGLSIYFAFEPSVGRAISQNFTVTQQVTNEISFQVAANNVTMNGSIAGLTGGYATGTTVTVVNTNNASGYNMRLHFATTSSGQSMQASSTAYINDYTPSSAGVPDYAWADNTSGQPAEFGYSVHASTTGEVDPSFRDNGSACNAGSNETTDRCWLNPTTTPETIINSTIPNSSSTTTIKFKVAVPNSSSPALPSGYYVATGTLTALVNP